MSLRAECSESGWYDAQVICDECGGRIQSAEDGLIEWRADGKDAEMCFTHKLCRGRFQRNRRGRWRPTSW
jgi:hypothetical protein